MRKVGEVLMTKPNQAFTAPVQVLSLRVHVAGRSDSCLCLTLSTYGSRKSLFIPVNKRIDIGHQL
jgi:hypothetical protein